MFYGYEQTFQRPFVPFNKPYKKHYIPSYMQSQYVNYDALVNQVQLYPSVQLINDPYYTYNRSYTIPFIDDFTRYTNAIIYEPHNYYGSNHAYQNQYAAQNQYTAQNQVYSHFYPQIPLVYHDDQYIKHRVPLNKLRRSQSESSLKFLLDAEVFPESTFKDQFFNQNLIFRDQQPRYRYEKKLHKFDETEKQKSTKETQQKESNQDNQPKNVDEPKTQDEPIHLNNGTNIETFEKRGIPSSYRVHDRPLYSNYDVNYQMQYRQRRNYRPVFMPSDPEKLLRPKGFQNEFYPNWYQPNLNFKSNLYSNKRSEGINKSQKNNQNLKPTTSNLNIKTTKNEIKEDLNIATQSNSTNSKNPQQKTQSSTSNKTNSVDDTNTETTENNYSIKSEKGSSKTGEINSDSKIFSTSNARSSSNSSSSSSNSSSGSSKSSSSTKINSKSGRNRSSKRSSSSSEASSENSNEYQKASNNRYHMNQKYQHNKYGHQIHNQRYYPNYFEVYPPFYNPYSFHRYNNLDYYEITPVRSKNPYAITKDSQKCYNNGKYNSNPYKYINKYRDYPIYAMHKVIMNSDNEVKKGKTDEYKKTKNQNENHQNEKQDTKKVFGPSDRALQAETKKKDVTSDIKPTTGSTIQNSNTAINNPKKRYNSERGSLAGSIFDVPLPSDNLSEYSAFVNNVFSKALDK